MTDRASRIALLAPLPDDAVPTCGPVAPPEILSRPEGAAVAGWEQLVWHVSDASDGLRTVLVVVDTTGSAISASDAIFRYVDGEPRQVFHETIGGRFEADGRFLGTHWTSVGPDVGDEGEAALASTRSAPTADEVAALRALVDEMLRRRPPRS